MTLSSLLQRAGTPDSAMVSDGLSLFSWGDAVDQASRLDPARWHGRSVLLAVSTQIEAARALVLLDGLARRIVLLPPDVKSEHLGAIVRDAAVDIVLCTDAAAFNTLGIDTIGFSEAFSAAAEGGSRTLATEWLMLTSGTTGEPKIAVHTLAGLTGAIAAPDPAALRPVWATFYDIRRYGGLQIYLRAVAGGASLVLSRPDEPVQDHLRRLAVSHVTHVSGTPTHWRRALMSEASTIFTPGYIRLSGEIADQAILDGLKAAYPASAIGHAYASTEAGVGFDVNDGLEGFPQSYLAAPRNGVEMRIVEGALQIRSSRTSSGYAGRADLVMKDDAGWVDTGDMIEQRNGRCYFSGRRGGIINVGGLKVHPEEIEAVINRHEAVQQSRVRSRKSPVIGAIVVADIVLKPAAGEVDAVKQSIAALCRASLPPHKVPAVFSTVASIEMTSGGKVARHA